MIPEPLAAAIGIGIDIEAPVGSMIVDIGGGTTEIAVIALAGIVCDQSIKVAGDAFNKDILDHMRRKHNLLIGERTAEKVKLYVGAAMEDLDEVPPPELSADIYDNGIYLTGGGALLRGLDKRLMQRTNLPVHIAEDPLQAVVRGTGIALQHLDSYKRVLMS